MLRPGVTWHWKLLGRQNIPSFDAEFYEESDAVDKKDTKSDWVELPAKNCKTLPFDVQTTIEKNLFDFRTSVMYACERPMNLRHKAVYRVFQSSYDNIQNRAERQST